MNLRSLRNIAGLVIASVFLLAPNFAFAAIAFDQAFTGANNTNNPQTLSCSTSGSNRLLIVGISEGDADGVTGVTYNGVAMTFATKVLTLGNSTIYLYYLPNPATGSNTVSVSFSSNPTGTVTSCSSYTGVSQSFTADVAQVFENASGDRTVSVTVSTANSWLAETFVSFDVAPTAIVNGVNRGVLTQGSAISDSNTPLSTGAQTIGYHWNSSDRHGIIAMSFPPFVASATLPQSILSLVRAFWIW